MMKKSAKTLLLAIPLIIISAMNISVSAKDKDGHTLVRLWEAYYKAVSADKPKDQLKALDRIKEQAAEQKLAWDYYDACERYVRARTATDWKVRSAAEEDRDREIRGFGEPVAVFFLDRDTKSEDELYTYMQSNAAALKKSRNPEFYTRDYRFLGEIYSEVLAQLIADDYEYALWCLFRMGHAEAQKKLSSLVAGHYPQSAFMEYSLAKRTDAEDGDLSATMAFAAKHKGRAVALFARQDLLADRFRTLSSGQDATEEDYVSLNRDCSTFAADQKRFPADIDKKIAARCTDVSELIKTLNSKDIAFSVNNGALTLMLRNLSSAQISVTRGKESVFTKKVSGRAGRFYIYDTLTVDLPAMHDGVYDIVCSSGRIRRESEYLKYTLSLAMKRDRAGYAVYVADFLSGRPVEKCDIISYENGRQTATVSGLVTDGYTYLPESMVRKFGSGRYDLAVQARITDAEGKVRLSRRHGFASNDSGSATVSDSRSGLSALILTDRSAFRPGERVRFKTVAYTGDSGFEAAEGIELTAELRDTRDRIVSSVSLKTNEFGSAAAEFDIPRTDRAGNFSIQIRQGRTPVANRYIKVDDFVLPTFDLEWSEDDRRIYLPGDEIKVRGKIKAYSGHNLASAEVSYRIGSAESRPVTLGPDGSFVISFTSDAQDGRYYAITVRVTDATGETLEFSTSRNSVSRLNLKADIMNACEGSATLPDGYSARILNADRLELEYRATFYSPDADLPGASISYILSDGSSRTVSEGRTYRLGRHIVSLAGLPSGLYKLESRLSATSENGRTYESGHSLRFAIASDSDKVLDFGALSFFKECEGDGISLQIGTTSGPVWAVAELYGDGDYLLDKRMITLSGEQGEEGSLASAGFGLREDYPERLLLHVIYFRDGSKYEYNMNRTVQRPRSSIPLEFTKFLDTTAPGHGYRFLIRTAADTECAAAIFDASTETVMSNVWYAVQPYSAPLRHVTFSGSCGIDRTGYYPAETVSSRRALMVKSAAVMMDMSYAETAEEELEAPMASPNSAAGAAGGRDTYIRENFATTVAWEPFLRSDRDGVIALDFNTGDRLSRYCVQLYAHDKKMGNSVLRREMLVTLPVKIAVVQPRGLFENDRYTVRVTLSNMFDTAIRGRVEAKFYNGGTRSDGKMMSSDSAEVTVGGSGSAEAKFATVIPAGISELGMLLSFTPEGDALGSDAVFVSVPVKKAVQTVTESHSALLTYSTDRNALIDRLRKEFVNADGSKAAVSEISILDMLSEAVPERVLPASGNIMDLSDALYANILLSRLPEKYRKAGAGKAQTADMTGKIKACANLDGGFAWFSGMESSPLITAAVLERFAAAGKDLPGELAALVPAAVKYLDSTQLGTLRRPYWCWISLEQYLHVRAMYPEVPFEYGGDPSDKVYTRFKKDVGDYLVPSSDRRLNGRIFDKARRLQTLRALNSSKEGRELARSLGIGGAVSSKIEKSIDKDVASLLQYAVPHKSGGIYYPNAVMPWRGLLESELYAHSQLCRLLSECGHTDVAEGIRLWIMVQKETQKWEEDAAYIEALGTVLAGSEATLHTAVIALSAGGAIPFADVRASGNGMKISLSFTRDGKPLKDGDVLRTGDKITGEYKIWNEENRSFIKITAPRSAALRPVQQLSGHIGWRMRPLSASGYAAFSPQGYRSVFDDRTEFWFDSYPEETTTVTEEYFVTQEGTFQSPVPVVESIYAPHYRANAAGRPALTVK